MGLFVRRPLALASLALVIGIVLGFCTTLRVLACIAVILILCILVLAMLRVRRGANEARLLLFLLTLFLLLGTARGYFAEQSTRRLTQGRIGTEVEVELSILETRYAGNGASTFSVRVHELNGERERAKALLSCSYTLPLYPGDRVRATVRLETQDHKDETGQNRGDGVQVVLVSESSDSFVFVSHTEGPRTFFGKLQSRLSYHVRRAVGGEEGNLVAAVLLGDDAHLSQSTVRDFRRTGISHLLALSGLHISILVGFAEGVLRLCRVAKRPRMICTLVFAVFYFFLTGGSYSVLRTLIMLGFVSLAFFLSAENDGVTALLFGAAAVLMVVPYAVFELSLQMTVLATLGILIFAPIGESLQRRFSHKGGIKGGIKGALHFVIRRALLSLLLTYSASVALLVIQWLTFGQLSLLTPLANLLLVPLAMPLLVLGLLCLPLFFISGIAGAAGAVPAVLARTILRGACALSGWRGVLSLRHAFAPYIILSFLALTAVLVCVQLPRRHWITLTPIVPLLLSFAIAFGLAQNAAVGTVQVHYSAENGRDSLTLSRMQSGVICDVSGSDAAGLTADWRVLEEQGATELDALVLTGYNTGTQNALSEFSKRVIVRNLLLPEALNEAEEAARDRLLAWSSEHGITAAV